MKYFFRIFLDHIAESRIQRFVQEFLYNVFRSMYFFETFFVTSCNSARNSCTLDFLFRMFLKTLWNFFSKKNLAGIPLKCIPAHISFWFTRNFRCYFVRNSYRDFWETIALKICTSFKRNHSRKTIKISYVIFSLALLQKFLQKVSRRSQGIHPCISPSLYLDFLKTKIWTPAYVHIFLEEFI